MNAYAAGEWERALLSLRSSEQLLCTDPDSAASRAFYAAYHAVTALFALKDQSFTKHAALRAAVHRNLVNTGAWNVELGKDYDFLMDLRETGDYGGVLRVGVEDARAAIQSAARILDKVRMTCQDLPASCDGADGDRISDGWHP